MALPPPGNDANVDDLVRYYSGLMYTVKEICGFLLCTHGVIVSLESIKRIKRRLGLKTNMCESPLDVIVEKILTLRKEGYSNLGYRSMWRMLNVFHRIRATQQTVRNCLSIIDEQGVYRRSRRRLHRRQYSVEGPNFLMHIDGYDKLKPFGVAIHGAIDGFSRKILWLKSGLSNNNPKYIAYFYLAYLKSTKKLPTVIRSDRGTENVLVRDLQICLRMHHRDHYRGVNSFLVGRSSGNQRIERLWGTLRLSFTDFWKAKFEGMKDMGIFDEGNVLHIECLRYCYMNIIQNQLDVFMQTWNSHRIRSQRDVTNVHGIPVVLYHQPELFGTSDYSCELPCSEETVDELMDEFTEEFPTHGCSYDFRMVLQHLSGIHPDQIPIIESMVDADEMFTALVHSCDVINRH
ncbi:uncharacterized protein [Argopecten irradians]|uniref:uncharacterized protein n=1 Tax=Argopecten irradians TaxID=31199 RepID=UPI00371DED2C